MSTIFLSYSQVDRDFVLRLRAALGEAGKSVWADERDIPPTSRWADDIHSAIEGSDAFVFVISAESVGSDECLKELEHAVVLNKRIIPLNLRPVEVGRTPDALAIRQYVPHRGTFEDDFEKSLQVLVSAVDTDLDWVREHTQWGLKALEWSQRDRDRSFLLSGKELDEAEGWVARSSGRRPEPTDLQNAYLLASRQGSTRRQRRLLGGVSLALVVVVVLGVLALVQRNTAVSNERIAQSRQLSANAEAAETSDPELSTSLALQALHIRYTSQAETALREALPNFQVLKTFREPGHAEVLQASFSPDGSKILTGSSDGIARVRDASTGRQLAVFKEPGGSQIVASYSQNGKYVLMASNNGTARVWDVASGKQISVIREPGGQEIDASFSPNGDDVLTASSDGTARIWDVASGRQLLVVKEPGGSAMVTATFSPDGTNFLTANIDGTARLWSATNGSQLDVINNPNRDGSGANGASFSPDGSKVATIYSDGNADVWDVGSSQPTLLTTGDLAHLQSVAFSPDGSEVVTSSIDGTARVWDVGTGSQLLTLQGPAGEVLTAAFSPDGSKIVTGNANGVIGIWDALPREVEREPSLGDTTTRANGAAFNTTGDQIAVGDTGRAFVLNTSSGRIVREFQIPGGGSVTIVSFDHEDRTLLTAANGTVRTWSLQSGQQSAAYSVSNGASVAGASFSPNGKKIVIASSDGTVRILGTSSDQKVITLNPGGGNVSTAQFSPDGRFVVTANGSAGARIWNASSGALIRTLGSGNYGYISSAAYSPDGSEIVTTELAAGGDTRIWNAKSGRQLLAIPSSGVIRGTFSPNGRDVMTNGIGGVASIWNASNGEPLTVLAQGALIPNVPSATFSPDGRLAITTGNFSPAVWSTELSSGLSELEHIAQERLRAAGEN